MNDILVQQCRHLLLNLPHSQVFDIDGDNLKSVDEAAEYFKDSYRSNAEGNPVISNKTEFWGYCSGVQAWSENEYNTTLIPRAIAFPLLKKLMEVGDPLALKIYKGEVWERLMSFFLPVIVYLVENGHLDAFSEVEISSIVKKLKEHSKNLPPENIKVFNEQVSEAFRNSCYVSFSLKSRDDNRRIKINEIALEFNEKNYYAWYEIALSYQFLKQFDKAEYNYKKAIDINPLDNIAVGNLCDIFINQERYKEALVLLKKTLKGDPKFSQLWFLLGKVHFKTGDLDEALDCVDRSIKQYSQNNKVHELRDEILISKTINK